MSDLFCVALLILGFLYITGYFKQSNKQPTVKKINLDVSHDTNVAIPAPEQLPSTQINPVQPERSDLVQWSTSLD